MSTIRVAGSRELWMPTDDGGDADSAQTPASLDDLFDVSGVSGGPDDPPDREVENSGNWLSTGIEPLDRYLGGGIPPGRIVAFLSPAQTQGELLLKHIVAQPDSLYLSSLRPRWEVEESVRDFVQRVGEFESNRVDTRVERLEPPNTLQEAGDRIDRLGDRSVLVIDSMEELETDPRDEYAGFLRHVKRRLWDTGSIGLLHCVALDDPPANRPVTLQLADIVLELRRSVQPGGVNYLLVVSKFRGGRALTEPVKLELTETVRIDTSRDIA